MPLDQTGLPKASLEDIRGGTKEENAATMRRIFQGEPGPLRNIVLLNSGAALLAADRVDSIRQGVEVASRIIDSGEAMKKLDGLVELSQRLGEES